MHHVFVARRDRICVVKMKKKIKFLPLIDFLLSMFLGVS